MRDRGQASMGKRKKCRSSFAKATEDRLMIVDFGFLIGGERISVGLQAGVSVVFLMDSP
jgi:hypothetical protein